MSVEVTEKPPIKFFESFIGFVNGKTINTFFLRWVGFSVSLTVNHRYILWQTLARWFFGFDHRKLWQILARWFFGFAQCKTTDTYYGKFWLGGFLVSLTAKPPILFWEILARWFFGFAHRKTTDTIWSKIWDAFFLGTFQTADLRFQALPRHFFILMLCCDNRNRITAICKMSSK